MTDTFDPTKTCTGPTRKLGEEGSSGAESALVKILHASEHRVTPGHRKVFLAKLVVSASILIGFYHQNCAAAEPRTVEFETSEGTWMNLDVSPDGQQIVFDLLGDIYSMPAEGGRARVVATGTAWEHQPRFSPDGSTIAYASDSDGQLNLWVMSADGGSPRQVSHERLNRISSPAWCGDNYLLARRQDGAREELWMYHVDGGRGLPLPGTARYSKVSGPICSPDGKYAYFSTTLDGEYSFYHENFVPSEQVIQLDIATGKAVPITSSISGGLRPQISRDGRRLAFAKREGGMTSLWVRDLRTRLEEKIVARVLGDGFEAPSHVDLLPAYAFSPDGESLLLHLNGRITRVDVATGAITDIPFEANVNQTLAPLLDFPRRLDNENVKVRIIRWPALAADGSRLYFNALAKLWVVELAEGQPRRLTNSDIAEYAPALSPDGKWLTYTTWSDTEGGGHLMLSKADGSKPRQLTGPIGQYLNPTWSADGSKIAFVRGSGGAEQLQQEPAVVYRSEIAWINVATGEGGVVSQVRRPRSSERGHPVPTFSPDGGRIFYIAEDNEPGRRALISSSLNGAEERVHLRFPAVDEGAPSPDGTRVALVRGNNIYVLPLPAHWAGPIDIDLDNPPNAALSLVRIVSDRADFLTWRNANTLLWATGSAVFEANLGPATSAATAGSVVATSPAPKLVHDVELNLPRARPSGLLAIANARLITMRGDEVLESGTIIVDGNRIVNVGSTASTPVPRRAKVIDGSGLTVMPGLVDTHAHMHTTDYGIYPQEKWQHVASLAYGVTTTFDPASRSVEIFELRDMVDVGWMLGPRIYSSGTILGGFGPTQNPWYRDVANLDDARDVIRGHARQGVDMLKEYMHPRRDQRQLLTEAAREFRIPMTGEQGGDMARLLTMVIDGYTAVEHSFPIAPIYRDVVEFFKQSGTFHTPTFSIPNGGAGALNYFSARRDYGNSPKLKSLLPYDRLADYLHWRRLPDEKWFFRAQARAATNLSRAGGKVSIGSHNQYHGIAAHWELWARAEGGATAHEILRDATLRGGEKIGVDRDLGSLEVGKFADILVLEANPLDDIRNSAKIKLVVKDGFLYDAETMSQVWPDHQDLSPFFWQPGAPASADQKTP